MLDDLAVLDPLDVHEHKCRLARLGHVIVRDDILPFPNDVMDMEFELPVSWVQL